MDYTISKENGAASRPLVSVRESPVLIVIPAYAGIQLPKLA
jgi:hypothetical protein